jgi:hypothetical protein
MAGIAVPTALSGVASAKAPSTAPPTITKCTPAPATVKKTVTIKGTGLSSATSVSIGKVTIEATSFTHDSGKIIKFVVPKKVRTTKPVTVTVTTANGTGSQTCSFQQPTKKSHK